MPETVPGGAAPVTENPWASYGLNADGSPLEKKAETPVVDPRDAKIASLESKLSGAEEKLAKLPTDFEGMSKKMEVVDKLVKALTGESSDPKTQEYKKIWSELKDVAKTAAPGFFKQMERYESDPDWADKQAQISNALAASRLGDLNSQAHNTVLDMAKGVFKGLNAEELQEAVYPFESTMTEMINSNPELSRRFVNGDMGLVKELFQRLAKPHLANRLRTKQAMTRTSEMPKAMPKGSGAPQTGEGEKPARNLSTRQGKMDFHKAAIDRFLSRSLSDE